MISDIWIYFGSETHQTNIQWLSNSWTYNHFSLCLQVTSRSAGQDLHVKKFLRGQTQPVRSTTRAHTEHMLCRSNIVLRCDQYISLPFSFEGLIWKQHWWQLGVNFSMIFSMFYTMKVQGGITSWKVAKDIGMVACDLMYKIPPVLFMIMEKLVLGKFSHNCNVCPDTCLLHKVRITLPQQGNQIFR
jgi:hypothetical protein